MGGGGSSPGHTTRACQLLAASGDSQTSSLGELAVGNPGRPPLRCIACSRSRAASSKAAAVTGTVRASRLKQTSRQTKKQTNNQTNKQSKKQTNKQTNKQSVNQTNKHRPTRQLAVVVRSPGEWASILTVHLVVVVRSPGMGLRS